MGLSDIEKKSKGYSLLKIWVEFWHNVVFYKKFIALGTKNIPIDKPLIFTSNHQNALMDALALGFSIDKTLVFVARSDIFKKPAIAKILYFLKILPIYRVRDGYNSIKKNQEIIHKTIDIITSGSAMVILPEGNHSGIRRLRPLKKGFARMAFQTEEANNFNLDIHIVPVGIDYDNYQNYRSSLIVNFGKPISIKEYIEEYRSAPAIAINNIKDKLSEHIKPLMVNIESEEYYELFNELRLIFRSGMAQQLNLDASDIKNRIFIDQQTIERLSEYEKQHQEEISKLQKSVLKFVSQRDKLKLTNEVLESKGTGFGKLFFNKLVLLITSPIFVYGALNNILPYWLPIMLSKKMKDPQFQSSFKFVILLLTFPIFYIVQSTLLLLFFNSWEILLLYIVSLPLSATIAWWWKCKLINTRIMCKYNRLKSGKSKEFNELLLLYDQIIHQAEIITSN